MPEGSPHILVIGCAHVDILLPGTLGAWPEAGQRLQVDWRDMLTQVGGNGCSVSLGLIEHGCRVTFLTAVGGDSGGAKILSKLAQADINVVNLGGRGSLEPTTCSYALANKANSVDPSYFVVSGSSASLSPAGIADYLRDSEGGYYDAVAICSMGMLPGLESDVAGLVRLLGLFSAMKVDVVMDFTFLADSTLRRQMVHLRRFGKSAKQLQDRPAAHEPERHTQVALRSVLSRVSVVTPNFDEAKMLVSGRSSHDIGGYSVAGIAKEVHALGVQRLTVVKHGREGCYLYSEGLDEPVGKGDIKSSEIVDRIGAGDAWMSGFLEVYSGVPSAERHGRLLLDAARAGNESAAKSLRFVGANGWIGS